MINLTKIRMIAVMLLAIFALSATPALAKNKGRCGGPPYGNAWGYRAKQRQAYYPNYYQNGYAPSTVYYAPRYNNDPYYAPRYSDDYYVDRYGEVRRRPSKTKNIVAGTAIGAVAGALLGGKKGAVIGGAAGAGAGYLIYRKKRNNYERGF